ncbi:MAG: ABC transporter permease [Thiobacillaceae bacterium]|nr:ABC transporter permease [Thiobacillaceae bacterium]
MGLTLRFFLRDLRAGELTALLLALTVAVAGLASVGFFTERVRAALARQAHALLGADLIVSGDHPLPPQYRARAQAMGLTVAEGMTFASMVRTAAGLQLAAVKAVEPHYPLRGELRTAPALQAASARAPRGPGRGEAWADARLVGMSGARVGEVLELGRARLRLAAILVHEPEQGLSFLNLAPRLLMHLDDVPATALVQPGSRIRYELYLAGAPAAVAAFRAWVEPRLARGQRVEGLADARPEVREALVRGETLLALAALMAAVLAAVAVGLAARRYVERHYDGFALLRCLGAGQGRLARLYAGQFLLIALAAGALGAAVGFAAHTVLVQLAGELIGTQLPPPAALPALQATATGVVLLAGFALPPLLQLKQVPALRVFRREAGRPRADPLLAYALGLATLVLLLLWQTGSPRLTAYTLAGLVAACALFAVAGRLLLALAARARHLPFVWRHGLRALHRRGADTLVQLTALALAFTALLLLAFTRGDLIEAWRARTPPDAPNRFILNIQPEQRETVQAFFRRHGLPEPTLYPMVRGRLIAINGRPVRPQDYADERTRALVEREFNLSYADQPPPHNRILAGRWFTAADRMHGALSIEAGIAARLNLRLGDRLTWAVAGREFSAPITSLRGLDWDSMQVNFFVITTPALLAEQNASYITSFHLAPAQAPLMTELVRTLPNLTVIDTTALLDQALALMQRMVSAVQFVFLFALAAAVLVLVTALANSQDERVREAALMRTLGASRRQILAAQRAEWLALGLLAGTLAAAAAAAIGALLARQVFDFPRYAPDPWLWAAGPALGLAAVVANLWLASRWALKDPPLVVLREQG